MAQNKPLEMCKNAISVTNARGCFELFVKSTLYSTIILCARRHQKGIKLVGQDFFVGGAETPSSAWSNFFSDDFRPTYKIRRRRPNSAAQWSNGGAWLNLVNATEPSACMRRRYGLMSNYFDQLFLWMYTYNRRRLTQVRSRNR